MPLTLLLGGVRSGKSRLALRLALASRKPVVVIATGEARDEEMAERIMRHRAERPAGWETVEEPVDLDRALAGVPEGSCVVVDCLTLWVSNLMERGLTDEQIETHARGAAARAAVRAAPCIAVTNEVGSGIIPLGSLARRFEDLLGHVNAAWAGGAERVFLLVAGHLVPAVEPAEALPELRDG